MFEPSQEDSLAYSDHNMSNVSLLDVNDDDDEHSESAGLVSGQTSDAAGVPNSRRVDRYLTLREKLERLKQQAAAKLKSITEYSGKHEAEGAQTEGRFTFEDIQTAVLETIVKLTDPLYRDLDFESTLSFVDDIKSWSSGMPQMLAIVVGCIDKRLRNDDPQIAFLTLCLVDSLVKNTTQRFHACVATQPVLSTIARIARGSARRKMYTGDLRRDSKVMWQRLSDSVASGSASNSDAEARERERNAITATLKAKEVIKSWGEGFVQTQASLPLFAATYQTLLNEGMDFGNVNVEGAIVLDAPDADFAGAAAVGSGNTPDMSELCDGAHQTAKLLLEVCSSSEDSDDGGLVALLVDQCVAQQAQLASIIEIAMSTNDEPQMISALAANETLQEALESAQPSIQSNTTAATSTSNNEFDKAMADVDSLLFDDSPGAVEAASAAPAHTEDLLDLDFFSPAAAPAAAPPAAPPVVAAAAPVAPNFPPPPAVAAPSFPPPVASSK